MDSSIWILLAVVVGWVALSRFIPGAGWGPKKQCGWTPPADKKTKSGKNADKPEDRPQ